MSCSNIIIIEATVSQKNSSLGVELEYCCLYFQNQNVDHIGRRHYLQYEVRVGNNVRFMSSPWWYIWYRLSLLLSWWFYQLGALTEVLQMVIFDIETEYRVLVSPGRKNNEIFLNMTCYVGTTGNTMKRYCFQICVTSKGKGF